MKTKEILSIFALVAIGLCLICGVAKTAMKSPKQKQSCDTACSLLVFVAVVLVGVSQLLGEIGTPQVHVVPGQGFGGLDEPCHPIKTGMIGQPYCDSGYICTPSPGTGPSLCKSSNFIKPKPGQVGGACRGGSDTSGIQCNPGSHCNNLLPPTCVKNPATPPGPMHFIKPKPGQLGGACGDFTGSPNCSPGLLCSPNGKCVLGGPCTLGMCPNGGRCALDPISGKNRCF